MSDVHDDDLETEALRLADEARKPIRRVRPRLARALWGRADGASVEVMTLCVVDLPTAMFRRALAAPDVSSSLSLARHGGGRLGAC